MSPSTGNILILRVVHRVHLGITQAHDQGEAIFHCSLRQSCNDGRISRSQTSPGLRFVGKGLYPFPFLYEGDSFTSGISDLGTPPSPRTIEACSHRSDAACSIPLSSAACAETLGNKIG